MVPIVISSLRIAAEEHKNQLAVDTTNTVTSELADELAKKKYAETTVWGLFKVIRYSFCLLLQAVIGSTFQFLAPSLALQLKLYGYTGFYIGMIFAIPCVIYATLCPMMYLLTQRFPKPLVMLIGLTLMGISILLIAQSKIFGITPTSTMIVMGLLLLGGASPMISIPIMPEMLESIEKRVDLNYDPEIVNNLSSSLFVTMTGLGEAVGPILNAILIEKYGFTFAHEIYAYIMLGMAFVYFFAVGSFRICRYEYTGNTEGESEMTKS